MKKLALIALSILAFACKNKEQETTEIQTESVSEGMPETNQTPEQLGETIFNGKGNCISCHQVDTKSIGPSIQEIAKIYKEKNANIVTFLKGESDAIVDPSQFAIMQANLELTKTFSDKELQGLEAYINSNLK